MVGLSFYLAIPVVLIASAQSYFLKTTSADIFILKLPILVACVAVCWCIPGYITGWFKNKLDESAAQKQLKAIEDATWMALASGDASKNPRAALTSILAPILKNSNVAAKAKEALNVHSSS